MSDTFGGGGLTRRGGDDDELMYMHIILKQMRVKVQGSQGCVNTGECLTTFKPSTLLLK